MCYNIYFIYYLEHYKKIESFISSMVFHESGHSPCALGCIWHDKSASIRSPGASVDFSCHLSLDHRKVLMETKYLPFQKKEFKQNYRSLCLDM